MKSALAVLVVGSLLPSLSVGAVEPGLYWRLSPTKCMASAVTTCTFYGPQLELLVDVGFTNSERDALTLPPLDVHAHVELAQGERQLQVIAHWERTGRRMSSVEVEDLIEPTAQPLLLPPGSSALLELRVTTPAGVLRPGTYTLTVDLTAAMAEIRTEEGSLWRRRPGRKESWTIIVAPVQTPESEARYNMLEGIALARRGDCADALPYLLQWRALMPRNTAAALEVGRCLLKENRWPEAEAALLPALQMAVQSRRPQEIERLATMIAAANQGMGRPRPAVEAALRSVGLSEDEVREVMKRIK